MGNCIYYIQSHSVCLAGTCEILLSEHRRIKISRKNNPCLIQYLIVGLCMLLLQMLL